MRVQDTRQEMRDAIASARKAGTLVTVIEFDAGFVGMIERTLYQGANDKHEREAFRWELEGNTYDDETGEPYCLFGFADTETGAVNAMLDHVERS